MEHEEAKPLLPVVPLDRGPPTIGLNLLLDFAIQQVFHELTVLSELLPKKLDADKKISLVQFAHSTRILFVKLLAMVKWVKSSKKFEANSSICYLLDQQAQMFVETADRLVDLSRSELVYARLPSFQVSSAVDVLTEGTFSRLPLCIRGRFIKDKKILPRDQALTLQRLNQVLQYRVSRVSSLLSPEIKEIRIKNGMVTLVVPGEFEVQLTLLGEAENTQWTLLNIKMLVEDHEIGYGTQLVHPLQLNQMHTVIQSRMNCSKNPLGEVFNILHSFAQSLQLDVLSCQCSQLSAGRLRQKLIIEKYDPKEKVLTIGYWVQKVMQRKGSAQFRLVPQYRFMIYAEPTNGGSLRVRHYPNAPNLGNLDLRTGRLSIDRLLSETLAVRCRERLLRIRKRLEAAEPKAYIRFGGKHSPCLVFPLLRESVDNVEEHLVISVNMFTGKVQCKLPALDQTARAELRHLEKALYDFHGVESLRKQLDRFKILLMIDRYKRSVSTLQVRVVKEAQMAPLLKTVKTLPTDRICLQFLREESYYLIICFEPNANISLNVHLHLMSLLDGKAQLSTLGQNPPLAEPLNHVLHLEHNTFADSDSLINSTGSIMRMSHSIELLLGHAIATVDDRLSFMKICTELDKHQIKYKFVENEAFVGGAVIHLNDVQSIPDKKSPACPEFYERLTRCCLRLDNRGKVQWPFECCIVDSPLVRDIADNPLSNTVCTWVQDLANGPGIDQLYTTISERMTKYVHIFDIVHNFAKAYKIYYKQFCSVVTFTFHKLVLAYGERRDQLLIIYFQPKVLPGSPPNDKFKITFGQTVLRDGLDKTQQCLSESTKWNAHSFMATILTQKFNRDRNLVELVQYLISTSDPLRLLGSFCRTRFISFKATAQLKLLDIPYSVRLKCYLVPVNEYSVRLTYNDVHLEFAFLGNRKIAIRDSSAYGCKAVGLHDFFQMVSNGTAESCMERPASKSPMGGPGATGPSSLPNTLSVGASPSLNLLSAPPHASTYSPAVSSGSNLICTKKPIIVDHSTLQKACEAIDTGDGFSRCLLDDYLYSLSFLPRLFLAFDATREPKLKTIMSGNNTVQELVFDQKDTLRLVVRTVSIDNGAYIVDPGTLTLIFYLCPSTFRISVKISYNCDNAPGEQEIAILERYFSQIVWRLNNEFAVISFVQICRIIPHNLVTQFCKLLRMEMDGCQYGKPGTLALRLAVQTREQGSRKYMSGVLVDPAGSFLALIRFTNLRDPNAPFQTVVRLFFSFAHNTLKQQGTSDDFITSIIQHANSEARPGEAPFWSVVSKIYARYTNANINMDPGSANLAPSVNEMPSHQGSVSMQMGQL